MGEGALGALLRWLQPGHSLVDGPEWLGRVVVIVESDSHRPRPELLHRIMAWVAFRGRFADALGYFSKSFQLLNAPSCASANLNLNFGRSGQPGVVHPRAIDISIETTNVLGNLNLYHLL